MNSHASQSSFLLDQSISEIKNVTIPSVRIFFHAYAEPAFAIIFFDKTNQPRYRLKQKNVSEHNFSKRI